MKHAASVLIELPLGALALPRRRPARLFRTRRFPRSNRSIVPIAVEVLSFHALGTDRGQNLPTPAQLFGGELHVLVVMTASLLVERRVVFVVLLARSGGRFLSRFVGYSVDAATFADFASAQRGAAFRFVFLRLAFGAASLDCLVHDFAAVGLDGVGEAAGGVVQAEAFFVEGGTVEGRPVGMGTFGFGRHFEGDCGRCSKECQEEKDGIRLNRD